MAGRGAWVEEEAQNQTLCPEASSVAPEGPACMKMNSCKDIFIPCPSPGKAVSAGHLPGALGTAWPFARRPSL